MNEASGSTTAGKEENPSWAAAEKRHSGRYEGPVAPVVASIAGVMAWCVFILLYALFWSRSFDVFQNLIVTVVSLIITGLAIGLMWVILGPKGAWRGGWK